MFSGFSQEALDFLYDIRFNNNKEWFEERKKIYLDKIYHPLKNLAEEIYFPFGEKSGMICKTARIYRDATFPPYLHYRDIMYIYVRYDALYWNRTPTLYFELSAEGAQFGFRIPKPEAAVMEYFRQDLTENSKPFLKMINNLQTDYNINIGGEEYKRPKLCNVPEAEMFFRKKGLSAFINVSASDELFSTEIAEHIKIIFKALQPLNDYFHKIINNVENEKALKKSAVDINEKAQVKAPDNEFMW